MNILEILLGQVPEALYFALFMIFVKKLKTKRTMFIGLAIIEYVLLLNLLPYSIWSHIFYFGISFIIMKILYKKRCQVTDIFTLGIASISMMLLNLILYNTVLVVVHNYIAFVVIDRVIMFSILIKSRKLLPKIQKIYKRLWNRNDSVPKHMKSTTFRCLNVVLFNFMFYCINLCMIYCIYNRR